MTIKEISRNKPNFDQARAETRHRKENLGFGPAILGLLCVASVFALLGVLYTIG